MSEPLHLLILEDNPADAELVQFELQEAGIVFIPKVVMNEEDFVRQIQEFSPDLILSDYDIPKYNGALALAEANRRCPDIPFILVTGAVTEDRAIDILTQGAKDYVLKNRLTQRLVPAVKRVLAEAEEQRARKQAEADLREAHRTLEERVKLRTGELEAEMAARKKTEESLRDSEERQRLVLQASSIGTFEVDLLTGEGRWNATEFELLGLKPGDAKASPDTFFRFVHPDDIERLRNEWEEATRSGKLDAEFRIVRADGRERWLAGKGAFIFDGHSDGHDTGTSGKPLRFMGVNFDITGRKQAEEKAAAVQRQVQSIIDNTTAIIYALDLEERFLLANTSLAELLKSTPEKMIGKRRHDFMPKQDADWHEANDHQVIEAGKALEFEEYSQLPDHSITWLTTKFPLRDAQGRIYAVGGISTNVTEHRKADEAVRKSEERFRRYFELGLIGMAIATVDKGITEVNETLCEMLGYNKNELLQRTWAELTHADDLVADLTYFSRVLAGEMDGYQIDKRFVRKNGDIVDTILSVRCVRTADGAVDHFVALVQDITERKIAAEALRASDEQFRVLIQNLQSAIALIDEHGTFRIVNNSFLQVFEIPQDATILNVNNRDWSQWQVFDEQGVLLEVDEHPVRKAALTRKAVKNQLVAVKSPSSPDLKWLLVSTEPILNKDGGIHRLICTYYDITQRKEADEALRASEKKYRSLFENILEMVAVYEVERDDGGRIVERRLSEANPAFLRAAGISSTDEVRGKTSSEIFGKVWSERHLPAVQKAMDTGEVQVQEVYRPESDRHYMTTVVRLDTDSYLGTSWDITERKRAEERLRESEEKYRNLVKYAPAAIYEMDLKGTKFFSVNDAMCDILGYSREELLSMKPTDLLDQEGKQLFKERIRKKLAGEKIDETIEYHIKRKDREWIQVAVYLGGYTYTNESPTRVAVVAYDITEQKKAEKSLKERTQQLENANKELESFSYSVSHDLRAPLRAIDGYSKMILRQQGDKFDENTKHQFDVIRQNTKMMGQLIDDLLALSRLGREALSLSRLSMEDITRDVWKELKVINPDTPVDLRICDIPPVMGDRSLIKQVLVNILSNAVKFSKVRETPVIEVSGYEEEKEIIYYVRDNGIGFDMQYHDKLFGVFQRLHSSTEYEGTGVGLAIVQRIIHRHGGRIWAEGEVDKGATFYFSLPTDIGYA